MQTRPRTVARARARARGNVKGDRPISAKAALVGQLFAHCKPVMLFFFSSPLRPARARPPARPPRARAQSLPPCQKTRAQAPTHPRRRPPGPRGPVRKSPPSFFNALEEERENCKWGNLRAGLEIVRRLGDETAGFFVRMVRLGLDRDRRPARAGGRHLSRQTPGCAVWRKGWGEGERKEPPVANLREVPRRAAPLTIAEQPTQTRLLRAPHADAGDARDLRRADRGRGIIISRIWGGGGRLAGVVSSAAASAGRQRRPPPPPPPPPPEASARHAPHARRALAAFVYGLAR